MKAEKKFQKLERIGFGTYGEVFRCLDKEKNEIVAIKKIKIENKEEGIIFFFKTRFSDNSNFFRYSFNCFKRNLISFGIKSH